MATKKMRSGSSSSYSDEDNQLTPTTSNGSTRQNSFYCSGVQENVQTIRNRNPRSEDTREQLQQEFCTYNKKSSHLAGFNNDDDDLYDMPHENIQMNRMRRIDLERQRSLTRTQNRSLSNMQKRSSLRSQSLRNSPRRADQQTTTPVQIPLTASQPEMQQISSPIPHMYYQASQPTSPNSAFSRRTSCSSNNDFFEYERRLREDDLDFHQVSPTIPSRDSNPSGDSQSTRSSNYPSLSYSRHDSLVSDGSWQGLSSIESELETPSESYASTLDCESVIYNSDGDSSVTDRSQRPRSHHHG